MAPPRALLLAALLAATAGLALCQVNVKTTVVEDVIKRVTLFPDFKVPAELLKLIPLEKDVPNGQQIRNNYRMIYRGDLPFADAKKVCQALAQKKKASITATKKKISETVDVAGADKTCTALLGMAGASPKTTFIILIKRRTREVVKMFTVLRCAAGSNQCQLWRLARPCPRGRCSVEADPTLTSQVFSGEDNLLEALTAPEEGVQAISEAWAGKSPEEKIKESAPVMGVFGLQPQSLPDVLQLIKGLDQTTSVLSQDDPKATHERALTPLGFYDQSTFNQAVMSPEKLEVVDDPDADVVTPSASSLGPAAIIDLIKKLNHADKLPINPSNNKQGSCNLPGLFTQIAELEARIPEKALKKCRAKYLKDSKQKCVLSRQFIVNCMQLKCGDKTHSSQVYSWVKNNLGHLLLEADYPSTNLKEFNALTDKKSPLCPSKTGNPLFPKSASAAASGPVILNATSLALEDPNFSFGSIISIVLKFTNINYKKITLKSLFGRRLLQTGVDRPTFVKQQLQSGPMSVHLSGNVLQYYGSGIINSASCCATLDCMNFAAQLVGYDDDGGYWLLTAPLGEGFGENGFFKLKYSDAEEYGPCGLFSGIAQVASIEVEEVEVQAR